MFKKCVYARILMDMWAIFVLARHAQDEPLLVIVKLFQKESYKPAITPLIKGFS